MSDAPPPRGLSALMQLLNAEGRGSRVVPFPGYLGRPVEEGGKGARVGVWALGFDELEAATDAAWKYLADVKKFSPLQIAAHEDLLDVEKKVHILHACLRDPDEMLRSYAKSVAEVRQMHPDVIEVLFRIHLELQVERSPYDRTATLADMEGELEALGKGQISGTPKCLLSSDFVTLVSIISSLAARVFRPSPPTTPSSSDTSPASDSNGSSTDS